MPISCTWPFSTVPNARLFVMPSVDLTGSARHSVGKSESVSAGGAFESEGLLGARSRQPSAAKDGNATQQTSSKLLPVSARRVCSEGFTTRIGMARSLLHASRSHSGLLPLKGTLQGKGRRTY